MVDQTNLAEIRPSVFRFGVKVCLVEKALIHKVLSNLLTPHQIVFTSSVKRTEQSSRASDNNLRSSNNIDSQ